jgi:hypothetical protein
MNTRANKKPILLKKLGQFDSLERVIIESLEQALYRLEVEVDGCCYFVMESSGKILTKRSILDIQALLIPFTIEQMFLRQISPYDEMIGHEVNANSNEMLVPLGNYFADLPDQTRH